MPRTPARNPSPLKVNGSRTRGRAAEGQMKALEKLAAEVGALVQRAQSLAEENRRTWRDFRSASAVRPRRS